MSFLMHLKGEIRFLMKGPSSDPPSSQGIPGGGDNRKDTSNRSYRKHPLLL